MCSFLVLWFGNEFVWQVSLALFLRPSVLIWLVWLLARPCCGVLLGSWLSPWASFDGCIHIILSLGHHSRLYCGLGICGICNVWTYRAAYLEIFGCFLVCQWWTIHIHACVTYHPFGMVGRVYESVLSCFRIPIRIGCYSCPLSFPFREFAAFKYASVVVVPSSCHR